ncbi:hypothetical protein [Thauera phenylacetica]|jgi:hypothetical protein|uniref:hypothetical protein n=1 Tax=Thauera phenylacetica TaxID=164400 RepID=UPI001B4E0012|nr:hypothetical protein [Thauera sp.]MBP8175396.1 hypothetical protein [Sphaerotilus sp.]
MPVRPLLSIALLLAFPSLAIAQSGSNLPSPEAAQEQDLLEQSRTQVRGFSVWLGETVNDWFGDRPFEDGGKVTHGRLGLRNLWRQDEGWDTNVRFRARFDLPNLREKAYVFIGRQNERELLTDQSEAFTREQLLLEERRKEDQTGFAGVGLALRKNLDFRVGVRGGMKFYTQARYRKQWALTEQDRIEFRETIFWNNKDKFGSTTALDYEHAFTPTLSLHWQNATTISEKTDDFAWGSSLGLFKRFGDDRILSGEMVVTGETGAKENVDEYGVRMKWTQPVYREWLIGEFIVGHYWPQREDRERERAWGVGVNLEMRF